MALKVLLKKSKLDNLKKQREAMVPKFEELKQREEELVSAIEEIDEETTEEEQAVVESKIEELEKEKEELEKAKDDLEKQIKEIETEIEELEEETTEEVVEEQEATDEERNTNKNIEKREGVKMNKLELRQLVEREEVKGFLGNVRNLMQGRAIEGGKLTVPTTIVDVVRTETEKYSKLINKVDKREVRGIAREIIIGDYPEAVWIETCTNLNELSINIYDVEIDGYTVGGFIPVCRAGLVDSDLDLASEVVTAIGQAIGKAIDKAIVYGTGKKMPVGIVTRLAQTAQPDNYRVTNQAWTNLSTTNIKKVTGSGATLFKNFIKEAKFKKDSKGGDKIWIMSENTKNQIVAESLTINAAGAIVTGVNDTMPIVGGEIITLDFIPDGDIIGGYAKQYLLAEREGIVLENSDDVLFLQHKRVYKGLARYDGTPVNGAGFMLININNVEPTTTVNFALDKANETVEEANAE